MATPKRYFHDRVVLLLLLSISMFLTIIGSLLILLRLDTGRSSGYIIQYRANIINEFKTGSVVAMLSFVAFLGLVLVFHVLLSKRVYPMRRHVSIAILWMGVLLLTMGVVVSNALLILR